MSNPQSQTFNIPPFFPITTPPKIPSPYGKKGSNSLAARLASQITENKFSIDEEEFYGEIWMSDHHSNPSLALLPNGHSPPLHDLIRSNPSKLLSKPVYEKFHPTSDPGSREDPHIPFIFKVLSFDKALPLQTHPDRSLAGKLHAKAKKENPGTEAEDLEFPDKNYKPEVAVCISEDGFEGFVGFRPIKEIQEFIRTVEELRAAISTGSTDDALIERFLSLPPDPETDKDQKAKQLLRDIFSKIILKDDKSIVYLCQKLLMRIDEFGAEPVLGSMGAEQHLDNVIRKLLNDYPGDKGMFISAFFMNYSVLKKGQGILVGVDELHAYLKGDIIECMAWGDNMLAHGFQPPQERSSPETFIASVSYNPHPSSALHLFHQPFPASTHNKTTKYNIPLDEFDLLHISLPQTDDIDGINAGTITGPSIFLVVRGKVEISMGGEGGKYTMERGRAVYVLPGVGWEMRALHGGEDGESGADVWGVYVE